MGTEKHLRDDGLYNAGHISVFFLGTYVLGFFLKRILQQDRIKGRREWESHDTIPVPPPPTCSGMLYPLHHSSITEYIVLSSRFPSLCPSSSHSPVLLYLPEWTIFILICHISSFHAPSSKSLS